MSLLQNGSCIPLREQFEGQCHRAKIASEWKPGCLIDVTLVQYPGDTRVSIIGSSISRAAYALWPAQGARMWVLRVYQDGQVVEP